MDFLATWRVIDLITAPARRIQQAASAAQSAMDRAGRAMGGSFNTARQSVNELKETIDAIRNHRDNLRIGIDTRQIRDANRDLIDLQNRLRLMERMNSRADGSSGGGSGGLMAMMSRRLLPLLAVSTLAAGAKSFVGGSMGTEKSKADYQQFAGEKKGLEVYEQLKKFGNDTIYKNSDVLREGARITEQFGANKALSQMKMYGNLAGGDSEALHGLTRTMGQIKGVGHLQGDELNELANHGILGLQEKIASMKGVSVAMFYKMKEAGQISFNDVQKAMEAMTEKGGKYYGRLERISNTTFGRMQKLVGNVTSKFTELGETNVLPTLNKILDWVNKFVDNFKPAGDAIMKFGKSFFPFFNAIKQILIAFGILPDSGDGVISTIDTIASVFNKLAVVVGFVGSVFNNLVTGIRMLPFGDIVIKILSVWAALQFFGGVTGIFNTVKVAWLALNAGFLATPIGWIVVGVVALVAALTYAWQNSEKFREVVIRSWEAVKAVWNSMKPYFDKVGTWISDAWTSVVEFFGKLGNTLKDAKESILNIWDKFQTKTEGVFTKIGTFIKNTIRIALATATLGMSEVAIFAYNKFANVAKAGYNGKGANAVVLSVEQQRNRDKDRSGTEAARAARRLARMEDKNHDGVKDKPFVEMGKSGMGGKSDKGSGISDTVEGAKSRTINITIKNMIETINNNVSSEAVGKKVSDDVLDTLNRLFSSADRLAFE